MNYTQTTAGGIVVDSSIKIGWKNGVWTVVSGSRREIVSDEFMIIYFRLRQAEEKAVSVKVAA